MGEIFLYNHGGSENHGCEALVRSVGRMLGQDRKVHLLSESPQQDYHYDLYKEVKILSAIHAYSKFSLSFLKAYIELKNKGDHFPMDALPYARSIKALGEEDLEISIGGDIYCYDDYPKFIRLHEQIHKKGCKSVLWGCSLEKYLFRDPFFLRDMKRYDCILARESLTYRFLLNSGFKNIDYCPDSAFTLPAEYLPLPEGFKENNTVGLNISPLIIKRESEKGIIYKNTERLIDNILKSTDFAVALIPHVVWKDSDDRIVLKIIYEKFKDSGRVIFIDDCNCMQLKGYISRCRFFIGARTHATIAAYSSCIPTLAVGYSVKSRGIAADLFGTDEHYVLPVEMIKKKDDLFMAFQWLVGHEHIIREHLQSRMPRYLEQAMRAKDKISAMTGRDI